MQVNIKLAVLIDADNAQATVCSEILEEVAKYGVSIVRRAYGNWTNPHLNRWKEYLHKFAIQPIHQFNYTRSKNATDAALIIDAMDLLHGGNLDGFCLVSSDSDFTRLATRIRESGLLVYGFGEKKTPEAFISACDKFIFTEILRDEEVQVHKKTNFEKIDLKNIVKKAVLAQSKEDGWASLSGVGAYIIKKHPSFDPRNYGFQKLGALVKSLKFLVVDERPFTDGSNNIHYYIKIKGDL